MNHNSAEDNGGDDQYGGHSFSYQNYTDDNYDVRGEGRPGPYYNEGVHTQQIHHVGITNEVSRHPRTFSHRGQFEMDMSPNGTPLMEQDNFLYSEDSQRESASDRDSANSSRQVTQLHTLGPSKHEMPDHKSYFGNISGPEAEDILKKSSKRNSYLTRYSDNNKMYTVSVIFLINNEDKVMHIKLSIDTDNSAYSLEGTKKVFHTLDELLRYYERSRLSSEIRSLGSPCVLHNLQRKESRTLSVDENQFLELSGFGVKELTTHMLQTITQQNKEHREQMREQQRYFDEKVEREQDCLSRLIESQRVEDQRRADEQRRREEQKQNEFQQLIEQLGKQKELERQQIAEEHKKAEENRKIKELEDKLLEQERRFEAKQKKFEEDRKDEEAKRKAEEDVKKQEDERKQVEADERMQELERKLEGKKCVIF